MSAGVEADSGFEVDPAPGWDRRWTVDAALVARLVSVQFPHWSQLPVRPVEPAGWDNQTFRLGADLTVRLPSGAGYAAQVDKEHRWLPRLAPRLPLTIPTPLARGVPAAGYPFEWSVYRWIEGECATIARIDDPVAMATRLAGFLTALRRVDATGGPPPGQHSAFRGGPLATYDEQTRRTIAALDGEVDGERAAAVWADARRAGWTGPPVWFHGDVAAGNLLVRDGELAAVIDFGCAGVGDPACDVTIAWTFFTGASRRAFRTALGVDDGTWRRGRGWALWKALLTLAEHRCTDLARTAEARRVIGDLLDEASG